jgi:hypothetical protein
MSQTYEWKLHPDAQIMVNELVAAAVRRSPCLNDLARQLRAETSTRLVDWLDHIACPVDRARLAEVGYRDGHRTVPGIWRHPGAQLPAIVPAETWTVALRVDDAAAFAAAWSSERPVEGSPQSGFRRADMTPGEPVRVAGVERRSWSCGITPEELDDVATVRAVTAWRLWAERSRSYDGAAGVERTIPLAERMVELVGSDLASSYALELERRYWQRRNTAAVIQHARQDRLGLGWGNNDHHTFRSSRPAFNPLMRLLRTLGFEPREQFYAGAQAGWGAQVLEHPGNGTVVFADVDLRPDEVGVDFAGARLEDGGQLGTVGLWCALHGESVLAAGMHHLEGQFEFDALRDDLARAGIRHMAPFSSFPYLRQAFTEAEPWRVRVDRLARLVAAGQIDETQAERFAAAGAPGSHLENLGRRDGFKGFNQDSVSVTMRATDPRAYGVDGRG